MARPLSVKTRPLWSSSVLGVALAATVFSALYKVADNITMHSIIVLDDSLTAASAYFIFAGWIGVIASLGFAFLFGKNLVDPSFEGIKFGSRKMQTGAVLAGSIAGLGTLFAIWANRFIDPSTAIALGNLILVMTTWYDWRTKEVRLSHVLFPLLLVTGGGIMTSYNGGHAKVTLQGLLLLGLISNVLFAVSEIAEKSVRGTDGVNFFFWRFLWHGITGTLAALLIAAARGTLPLLWQTITMAVPYTPWFVMTMLFVFLGISLKLTAKKQGAVSVVLMVLSGQVVLGYVLTLVGNLIVPGLFGQLPGEPAVWLIRIIGGILIVKGIFSLRETARN
jgi:hypothetical protein